MLCKKCGKNIEDTSKFCGYCGEKVEVISENNNSQLVDEVINNISVEEENNDIIGFAEINLKNTVDVESDNLQTMEENILEEPSIVPIINEPVTNDTVLESSINPEINNQEVNEYEENEQSIDNNQINETSINQQFDINTPMLNDQVIDNNQELLNVQVEKNKKNNKLFFIIGGIILVVIAIGVVIFAFMKSSNNSISVLEKTLANLSENAQNSATVDVKLFVTSTTEESFDFSARIKTENKSNDETNIQVTINESSLFEEMNIYGSFNKEQMTMYMESSLIDMMGTTHSLFPTWIHYTISLDEIMEEYAENNIKETNLKDIIDEKHFVYIDDVAELKHYQLIIDQELINNIKLKLETIDNIDIKETLDSVETLEEVIKLDFYITKSNELSKIELDMTEYLEDTEELSSLIISFEFSGLNTTKVEIPNDAQKSEIDLETYMTLNAIQTDNYDYQNSTDIIY